GRLLVTRTAGTDKVSYLDPASGRYDDVDLHGATTATLFAVAGDRLLLSSGGAGTPAGARVIDLASGTSAVIRLNVDTVPDPAYHPAAEQMTFPSVAGREVHAIVYPPRNPDYVAPDGELPPYVAW